MSGYKDLEKRRATQRAWYAKNKEKEQKMANVRHQKLKERNREFIDGYLKQRKCVDCGNDDWRALEFDHVRGKKKYNIAEMVRGYSIKTIQKEIDKCEVRCANCHKIRHYEERGFSGA